MRGDGPHAGSGSGSEEVAADLEGEVDRALLRSAGGGAPAQEQPAQGAGAPDTRTVGLSEIGEALEEARRAGRAIVVLEVRRPGEGAVRARVPQMLWAALHDALHADPLEEERAATQRDEA